MISSHRCWSFPCQHMAQWRSEQKKKKRERKQQPGTGVSGATSLHWNLQQERGKVSTWSRCARSNQCSVSRSQWDLPGDRALPFRIVCTEVKDGQLCLVIVMHYIIFTRVAWWREERNAHWCQPAQLNKKRGYLSSSRRGKALWKFVFKVLESDNSFSRTLHIGSSWGPHCRQALLRRRRWNLFQCWLNEPLLSFLLKMVYGFPLPLFQKFIYQ